MAYLIKKSLSTAEWKNTIGKESIRQSEKTKRNKSISKYWLFDVYKNDTIIYSSVSKSDIDKISRVLFLTTENTPMRATVLSKTKLNNTINCIL